MPRQGSQSPLSCPTQRRAKVTRAIATAEAGHDAIGVKATVGRKTRQILKAGEVNISAYLPAEVNASLLMVQAKKGNNLKDGLAEALPDFFKKHNVPFFVELGEGR